MLEGFDIDAALTSFKHKYNDDSVVNQKMQLCDDRMDAWICINKLYSVLSAKPLTEAPGPTQNPVTG